MSDTATKIISLLERLSVVAPERWQLNCASIGMNGKRTLHLRMSGSYKAMSLVIQEGQPLRPRDVAHIHYAVLEEAHLRKLEWNVFQSVSLIDSSGIRVMTVGLSRNSSPIETTAAYLSV